ncbi:TetR/AcrR family transcriptional regulator [Streptomyces avicenniae]|uniref:TetR/AcrR family transcriptional regulator n=1 Tax=Streptomyces avicenniae TaxID=500153 RepID=UPI0006997E7C|nr:TetR/AcrR family transcriptional regulator [Streptomyces avicenniae]
MTEDGRRTTGPGGTARRGRPRSFDREAALEQAVLAFWEHGYETTSVADLTRVMGIGAPSLYAAFGDKKALFEECVARYGERQGSYMGVALAEEPTGGAAVRRLLREAAAVFTAPGRPRGCMVISSAVNYQDAGAEVAAGLRGIRNRNLRTIEGRLREDLAAGLLPPTADPATLARFVGTVLQGMSQQARDGATRQELDAVAEIALTAWPAV